MAAHQIRRTGQRGGCLLGTGWSETAAGGLLGAPPPFLYCLGTLVPHIPVLFSLVAYMPGRYTPRVSGGGAGEFLFSGDAAHAPTGGAAFLLHL